MAISHVFNPLSAVRVSEIAYMFTSLVKMNVYHHNIVQLFSF